MNTGSSISSRQPTIYPGIIQLLNHKKEAPNGASFSSITCDAMFKRVEDLFVPSTFVGRVHLRKLLFQSITKCSHSHA